MRRKDREITDFIHIAEIVERNNSAVVSMVDGDKPYGVMLNYAPIITANGVSLIFHCATEGRKIDCLRRNPAASVFINDREAEAVVLTDGRPSGKTTTHYRSVVLAGEVQIVDDLSERRRLCEIFLRHFGTADIEMPPDSVLAKTQFFLFKADEISGKQNV